MQDAFFARVMSRTRILVFSFDECRDSEAKLRSWGCRVLRISLMLVRFFYGLSRFI